MHKTVAFVAPDDIAKMGWTFALIYTERKSLIESKRSHWYLGLFIGRQWNNLFNSMISFIWMTTESIKFSEIESVKILFVPTKLVYLVKRLNNTMT